MSEDGRSGDGRFVRRRDVTAMAVTSLGVGLAGCTGTDDTAATPTATETPEFGDPDEADYLYTHEVEWVRVWQREEWA